MGVVRTLSWSQSLWLEGWCTLGDTCVVWISCRRWEGGEESTVVRSPLRAVWKRGETVLPRKGLLCPNEVGKHAWWLKSTDVSHRDCVRKKQTQREREWLKECQISLPFNLWDCQSQHWKCLVSQCPPAVSCLGNGTHIAPGVFSKQLYESRPLGARAFVSDGWCPWTFWFCPLLPRWCPFSLLDDVNRLLKWHPALSSRQKAKDLVLAPGP